MASFTNPAIAIEIFSFFSYLLLVLSLENETNFVYNGFHQAKLNLDGASVVRSNGILAITNDTSKILGHAFYPTPLQFTKFTPGSHNKSTAVNFSTNFIFSIVPKYPGFGGHGLTFVLSSKYPLEGCLPSQYLGLPNVTSNPQSSARMLAIEFDAIQNVDMQDINDNHVGIDISSLVSNISEPAAYYNTNDENNSKYTTIILKSGDSLQAWIDYDSLQELLNVSLSPLHMGRPPRPLISFPIDLSQVLDEYMYIGFSASTGLLSPAHNVHGWSFRIGGRAQDLDPTELPTLSSSSNEVVHQKGFKVGMTFTSVTLFILVIFAGVYILRRTKNKDEILEDWEIEYGARKFKYSELHAATRGFREKNFIGSGGFGSVYRGVVPSTGIEVAVKRISNNSRQGIREFVAEITSTGRLRHRNLVQLHGWCRRKDDLLLVYDYVPNGSLNKLLFDNENQKKKLSWEERYKILNDVAQALLYLHEECQQMVVHRDLKPSNILIDEGLNAKLGDFGLARTYEHGHNPDTTNIVGTLGYMAPELTRTGRATESTDVYSYGTLLLEVACGRRPIEPYKNGGEIVLVDWARKQHCAGDITRVVDPTLDN
ncbi:L-type lectin-domain containing receptor kinase S.4-like [Humulus lupulus]|uniref:L-type lectin-domain containing receptor kinase S.4-like n=1 Tax=Humulus lupulus TaxID=3486 RepID=UPI002B40D239|nr:L-type lectin-domain containing receptor kinase S.4-like [Humulus lupulus]